MMIAIAAAVSLATDGITMQFMPQGVTAKAGFYSPIQATFSDTVPSGIKKAPAGLSHPGYGSMKFGDVSIGFIVDGDKMYVDSNRDGDYTDDPVAAWTPQVSDGLTMYTGHATADIGKAEPVSINFYRFDPNDSHRANLKNVLLYYGDFGYEVDVALGGKLYKSCLPGEPGPNTSLWIDRNGDGKMSVFHEIVYVDKPFNFTGTTYVLKVKAGKLALEKSPTEVAMEPMPPNLSVGAKCLPFDATTMDGQKVSFPGTYKGKIVMIDFWATWCGPCMAEMPNVVKAYDQFHDKGFDILGISFDQEKAVDKINSTTKDHSMGWPQVYEGKYWSTKIGLQYDVSGIPFSLLVDGDTGDIIAAGKDMRGEALAGTIEKALAKKHGAIGRSGVEALRR